MDDPVAQPSVEKPRVFLSYPAVCQGWAVHFYDMLRMRGYNILVREYGPKAKPLTNDALTPAQPAIVVLGDGLPIPDWETRERQALASQRAQRPEARGALLLSDPLRNGAGDEGDSWTRVVRDRWYPTWNDVDQIQAGIFAEGQAAESEKSADLDRQVANVLQRVASVFKDAEDMHVEPDVGRLREVATAAQDDVAWHASPLLACELAAVFVRVRSMDKARELLGWAKQQFPHCVRPSQELLVLNVKNLIDRGRYAAALLMSLESPPGFPDSLRLRQMRGLAYRRKGDLDEAQEVLGGLEEAGLQDPETLGMLASSWMDRYVRTLPREWERGRQADQADVPGKREYLERSRDLYKRAYTRPPSNRALLLAGLSTLLPQRPRDTTQMPRDTYVGINVAAKTALLGDWEEACRYAAEVLAFLPAEPDNYWDTATVAEAHLIQGNYVEAARLYERAVHQSPDDVGSQQATWLQARRLLERRQASPQDIQRIAAAFPRLGPALDPIQEVRLAIVMYGGVSLAVYINGVAQELLHLVRATAPLAGSGNEQVGARAEELASTEKVYRKLAQLLGASGAQTANGPIPVRFVIDVLSGTSAGGINAIFLAKALARDQRMDQLKDLWVQQADFAKLLNDASNTTPDAKPNATQSLLDSKYMYRELLKALDGMDKQQEEGSNGPRLALKCAEQIDLFVTATDIVGLPLPLPLSDQGVREKRHRNVFHFRHGDSTLAEQPRADFERDNNPFLAYAARSTSAFPFAFEPMRLEDIDALIREVAAGQTPPPSWSTRDSTYEPWRRFYEDYLDAGDKDPAKHFAQRAFGDGGYLDNKPFSYAIEALPRRRADAPVLRKLLYVEPVPERLAADTNPSEVNVLQNVVAALFTLPRYETIRQDLEELRRRNLLVDRVERLLEHVEEDVRAYRQSWQALAQDDHHPLDPRDPTKIGVPDGGWAHADLGDMLAVKGVSYGGYFRLKVAAVIDDWAAMAAAAAGFRPQSKEFQGVRYLVRAYVLERYTDFNEGDKPTKNQLLVDFDVSYRLRRLDFTRNKLNDLYRLDEKAKKIFDAARAGEAPRADPGGIDHWPANELERERFRSALLDVRPVLNSVYQDLLALRQRLELGREPIVQEIAAGLLNINFKRALENIAGAAKEEERREAARGYAQKYAEAIAGIAKRLADFLKEPMITAAERCTRSLNPVLRRNELDDAALAALKSLWHYYFNYEDYDLVIFPILYQTGVGEVSRVEVHRVSPFDVGDDDAKALTRLAGTKFANFGGFLVKNWRRNDILWGRLNAANLLLEMFLPKTDPRKDQLLDEARDIIIEEEMKLQGRQNMADLLTTALQNLEDGTLTPEAAEQLRNTLQKEPLRQIQFGPQELRQYVLQTQTIDRTLNPKEMVRLLARSTQIVGKILEDLAKRYGVDNKPARWLTRLGLWFWGIVEVAVPGSLANLALRHWLHLLYVFEIVMILAGWIFVNPSVQRFGLVALGVTAVINVLIWMLGDFLEGSGWWKRLRAKFKRKP